MISRMHRADRHQRHHKISQALSPSGCVGLFAAAGEVCRDVRLHGQCAHHTWLQWRLDSTHISLIRLPHGRMTFESSFTRGLTEQRMRLRVPALNVVGIGHEATPIASNKGELHSRIETRENSTGQDIRGESLRLTRGTWNEIAFSGQEYSMGRQRRLNQLATFPTGTLGSHEHYDRADHHQQQFWTPQTQLGRQWIWPWCFCTLGLRGMVNGTLKQQWIRFCFLSCNMQCRQTCSQESFLMTLLYARSNAFAGSSITTSKCETKRDVSDTWVGFQIADVLIAHYFFKVVSATSKNLCSFWLGIDQTIDSIDLSLPWKIHVVKSVGCDTDNCENYCPVRVRSEWDQAVNILFLRCFTKSREFLATDQMPSPGKDYLTFEWSAHDKKRLILRRHPSHFILLCVKIPRFLDGKELIRFTFSRKN